MLGALGSALYTGGEWGGAVEMDKVSHGKVNKVPCHWLVHCRQSVVVERSKLNVAIQSR